MNRKIIVLINWKSITTKAKLFFWTNKKIKIPIEKAIEKFSLLWWSKINWKKNLIIFSVCLFVWLFKKREKKHFKESQWINFCGKFLFFFFENWKKFLTTRNKKKVIIFFQWKTFETNSRIKRREREKTIKPDDKFFS